MQVVGVDLAGADIEETQICAACRELALEIPLRVYGTKEHSQFPGEQRLCPETILMEDLPLRAVKNKKQSTLVQAARDLADGSITSLVTCANTGAVTAVGALYLKRFIHRPALIAELPLPSGLILALDMGAYVHATTQDLVSYAYIGAAYAKIKLGIDSPKVGLLNIGRERGRGPIEIQNADSLLQGTQAFCYVGNTEPADILSGSVNVLVTSGFAGNIFLKTAEAAFSKDSSSSQRKGALLVGVKKPLIKCHGKSSREALKAAIRQAYAASSSNLIQRLEEQFAHDTPQEFPKKLS
jgi:glycerol-3-phosphate acyltransferase PlsX